MSMIIITGPEGSGTTYAFSALSSAKCPPAMDCWPVAFFDGEKGLPKHGVHHVSLPCRRPARWLSEVNLPRDVKIVALIRRKYFAVRSAHCRFRNMNRNRVFEGINYDRAILEIEHLKKNHQVLEVAYEDLGDPEVRRKIENFCGLTANWKKFRNANTPDIVVRHQAGFFSCCSVLLQRIVTYFNKLGVGPELIDGNNLFTYYKKDAEKDITYDMFERPIPTIEIPYAGKEIRFRTQSTDDKYQNINHSELTPFINKYFSPSGTIRKFEAALIDRYKLDFTNNEYCGVYYRGTDKKCEITLPSYSSYIEKMREIYGLRPHIRFVVGTDEPEFIKAVKNSGLPYVYFKENTLSKSGQGVHKELKGEDAYRHAIIHFATTLIMSKCEHLVCCHSNGSLWMNLYRGHSRNLHVRSIKDEFWEE